MSNDEIRELIQLVRETGIAELEVQRGENRVRIRSGPSAGQDVVVPYAPAAVAPPSRPEAVPEPAGNDHIQKSPIVGTFYDAPKPGDPPFVKVGDVVEPGQVLCIIESMKLMNEIEAEMAGTVVAKLVENGQAVEYGQGLFAIRPR